MEIMFCRNCGKQIDDKAVVCIHCGVLPKTEKNFCYNCGEATQINQVICVKCGVALPAEKGLLQTGQEEKKYKNKTVAGLLAISLGPLGIHKFYLGYTKEAMITMIVFIGGLFLAGVPSLVIWIITFLEGFLYMVKSDNAFEQRYVVNKTGWF